MHSLLEDYLAKVKTQLTPLPLARRDEELRELRAHLLNAVATYREQGQSEDEAVQTAVGQFEQPGVLGKSIVSVWRRGETLKKRSFWAAAVCTLMLSFMLMLFENILAQRYMNAHGIQSLGPVRWIWVAFFYSAEAMVGAMIGLMFPRRAIAGTVSGLVLSRLLYWSLLLSVVLSAEGRISLNLPIMILNELFAALVTVLAAWAGSRWRGRYARLVRG